MHGSKPRLWRLQISNTNIACFLDWLIEWLIDIPIYLFIYLFICLLIYWFIDWFIDCLIYLFIYLFIDWLIDWLIVLDTCGVLDFGRPNHSLLSPDILLQRRPWTSESHGKHVQRFVDLRTSWHVWRKEGSILCSSAYLFTCFSRRVCVRDLGTVALEEGNSTNNTSAAVQEGIFNCLVWKFLFAGPAPESQVIGKQTTK